MSSAIIQHQGIVQNISDNQLEILIISKSACSSCKSKKSCSISEIKEKMIYVDTNDKSFRNGDRVNVLLEEKMGNLAVVFAYVLPFLVMISILIIGSYSKVSEPVMGAGVVIALTLYFTVLYLFRKQLGKKMTFKVEKQNSFNPLNSLKDEIV